MPRYSVSGRTATALTATSPFAQLWNPHSSKSIYVVEIHCWAAATFPAFDASIARSSARGTPASTVTPDIDNDYSHLGAPGSGALLDTSFSSDPTVLLPALGSLGPRSSGASAIGAGAALLFEKIEILAGTGLCLVSATNVQTATDVLFVWDE